MGTVLHRFPYSFNHEYLHVASRIQEFLRRKNNNANEILFIPPRKKNIHLGLREHLFDYAGKCSILCFFIFGFLWPCCWVCTFSGLHRPHWQVLKSESVIRCLACFTHTFFLWLPFYLSVSRMTKFILVYKSGMFFLVFAYMRLRLTRLCLIDAFARLVDLQFENIH